MAGNARYELVDGDEVGIYHCWSKCVRDEFLCGEDYLRNRNCDHRKAWIEDRQELLLRAFAIELLDYAILDNHFHQVLRTRPDIARTWSDKDVVRRWWLIHPDARKKDGSPVKLTKQRLEGLLRDKERICEWRTRLSSLSWFPWSCASPLPVCVGCYSLPQPSSDSRSTSASMRVWWIL